MAEPEAGWALASLFQNGGDATQQKEVAVPFLQAVEPLPQGALGSVLHSPGCAVGLLHSTVGPFRSR